MSMESVEQVRRFLRENGDEKVRETSRRFFKESEKILFHGLKSNEVRKIAKQVFSAIKKFPKNDIFAMCEELWGSGYIEEGSVACEWAYAIRSQYQPEDFKVFERWVDKYVSNWASCDTLCNHTVAAFMEKYPEFMVEIKKWTASENRWKKRAAAVTFIVPGRKGLWLSDLLDIADRLLMDPDDMVQKGYGWMLKAASEAHPKEVFDYVMSKKQVMPRTAFRYSLEKMPKEWRAEAMKKL